jgi:hypothetical protein
MSQTVAERAAEHIGESARQASRATCAIADAIQDGVGVVKHAVKQGGDAAEEFLDDTTERLQRHLVLTVATTFAVGIAAGALISLILKRK